jgi:hypothetical protein
MKVKHHIEPGCLMNLPTVDYGLWELNRLQSEISDPEAAEVTPKGE